MESDFIVTHRNADKKDSMPATITIRMDKDLMDQVDKLAGMSERSRNEVICMAIRFAMEHLKYIPDSNEDIALSPESN